MKYSKDLFWGNIPRNHKISSTKLGFFDGSLSKRKFFKSLKNPFYIWTGPLKISPLEEIKYDSKILNKIKKQELHFYLYEPLTLYVENYKENYYRNEFPKSVPYELIRSDYLDSIEIFIRNNELSNVKIFTCDYNVKILNKQYPNLNLNCFDVFLIGVNYEYRFNRLENNITKKFWCGNWKYATHRHLITAYLVSLSGNYSWNLKCNFNTLKENVWFNLEKISNENSKVFDQLKNGVEILENKVFSIDHNIPAINVEKINGWYSPTDACPEMSDQFLKSYKECFCAIVNESNYARPLGYFSEKTLMAMNAQLPFILVAPPHTLKYIKKLGFKTFDKWWDESYDSEEDHEKRMLMIFKIIDYIDSKSIEDLKIIYKEMLEILEYNREHVKTIQSHRLIL